ncbi:MAG TPA: phosphoribosyl-AMP cyclohydrolase [Hyphomonas sp.]|nr:phosphoribosyl-AMP cyclohydrolase [Hyphomonas sp.]HRJ01376.1 phosphoribosyl-AMP cyclohydrolase [Hyphomonas sp.]HRK68259.1 phosphoribosyl-AMP cyclohydrolase [Hyphomonas sp.]
MKLKAQLAGAAALFAVMVPAACATPAGQLSAQPGSAADAPITEAEVIAAQNAWGNALVEIATTYDTKGIEEARKVAEDIIEAAYDYENRPVLFKPTLAAAPTTFRTTAEGALAYFVGQNANFPGDTGFALKGWRSFSIDNAAVYINGDTAISMGNVNMTDAAGNTTTVDKTWAWTRDGDGSLQIVLHHSSLPYSAN